MGVVVVVVELVVVELVVVVVELVVVPYGPDVVLVLVLWFNPIYKSVSGTNDNVAPLPKNMSVFGIIPLSLLTYYGTESANRFASILILYPNILFFLSLDSFLEPTNI